MDCFYSHFLHFMFLFCTQGNGDLYFDTASKNVSMARTKRHYHGDTICGHQFVWQTTTDFVTKFCATPLGRQFEREAGRAYRTKFECNTRNIRIKSYKTGSDGNQYILMKECIVNPGYDSLHDGDRHSEKAFCNKFAYDRNAFTQAGKPLKECNSYPGIKLNIVD